jgi:hypothetical protein
VRLPDDDPVIAGGVLGEDLALENTAIALNTLRRRLRSVLFISAIPGPMPRRNEGRQLVYWRLSGTSRRTTP